MTAVDRTDYSQMFAADGTVLLHPDRAPARYRPLRAVRNFRKLMKDKEDTAAVFKIFESLPSKDFLPRVAELALSERGEMLRSAEPNLPEILDDHAALRRTPAGSLAHAYCDFMEAEGLSAAGLVAESDRAGRPRYPDLLEWFINRSRDTHDLFHVLTGYGRDALGEASLLGFSYEQNHNTGILFIAYAGARQIRKVSGTKAPLFAAIKEGRKLGKAAAKIAHQDIAALMREDIGEARARLGIGKPEVYRQCLAILGSEGILSEELTLGSATQPQPQAA